MPVAEVSFASRLSAVESRIRAAAARCGRSRSDVTLVAVSKKFSASHIREAYAAGLRVFGENYVQEFSDKRPELGHLEGAQFHLIGHLQSNKTRAACELFDVIQTADSAKLLNRLNTSAAERGQVMEVLLELKLSNEDSKTGASERDLPLLLSAAKDCGSLRVTGLMTVPPWSADPEQSRPYFRRLAELARGLQPEHHIDKLSMGMSGDLEVAIEEGATIVRVGTALFRAASEAAGRHDANGTSMTFARARSIIFTLLTAALPAVPPAAMAAKAAPAPQVLKRSPSVTEGEEMLGVQIRMRDGVKLAADVFLPEQAGRCPTVLVRTPYNRKAASNRTYHTFVAHGYALVVEDVRGRYASQGVFGPVMQEGPDGNDTINWIAEQPWSNGRVAMAGSSFLGIAQWWAAVQDNPHLLAIAPMNSGDDEYLDRFYSTGGSIKLGHRLLWLAENLTPPSRVPEPFTDYISHLPLRTADVAATGTILPLWRQALDHPSYDAYWKAQSIREQTSQIGAAVLSMGGWFDNYVESDLDAFARLALQHKQVETWIGPWGHNPGLTFSTVNFGREARLPLRSKQLDWFDRWLKKPAGMDVKEGSNPLLHIFVMGQDVWREEHEWPLARTKYTPLYMESEGNANSAQGDGTLRWQPVLESISDEFTYDPKDPVPTVGGAICCEPTIFPPGPLDQRVVEQRPDVLVYTSPPLTEELEVTGPVRTILYISTTVNDTDFTAKLVDVQPDGRALLVTDGIQRLRYRLSLDAPVMVKRNTAYQISVDTGVTSYVFMAGHRLRMEVSSSNFPRFDRNMNSAGPNADQIRLVKAKQTVFHEKGYPSAVILPVIPKERSHTLLSHSGR